MNTVKITSGIYRGRKIATPGGDTHPMGERERLALFNMITDKINGSEVLDAYAGSGALGIEALSRGASEVVFVDRSHVAMRTITRNCLALQIPDNKTAFYRGKIDDFCRKFVQRQGTALDPRTTLILSTFPEMVDIILADPPYNNFNPIEIAQLAVDYLKEDGILALSHPDSAPDLPGMKLVGTHKHAAAHLSIYAKN